MRKLIDDYRIVVASPGYLERRGTPMTPADLDGHAISFKSPPSEPRTVVHLRHGEFAQRARHSLCRVGLGRDAHRPRRLNEWKPAAAHEPTPDQIVYDRLRRVDISQ